MRLEKSRKGRWIHSKELLDHPAASEVVLFEPQEVLKEGDFERMVQGKEPSNVAMDLAVASMFFPGRIPDQKAELDRMLEALNKGYAGAGVAKNIGSMWMATGMLKSWLPAEAMQDWTKKELGSLTSGAYTDSSPLTQLRMTVGLKLLLPNTTPEHSRIKTTKRFFERLLKHLPIDQNQPNANNLELLAYGLLLFPELRPNFPIPSGLFQRIRETMDFTREHVDPFHLDDLDYFPKVMFLSTVLGHPGAHISGEGRIELHKPSSHKTSTSLPVRPQL